MIKRIVDHPDWGISDVVVYRDLFFIGHCAGHTKNGVKLLTIEEQTGEIFENLTRRLDDYGLEMKNILQLTVLLKNINDFNGMHSVWKKYFPDEFPARATLTSDFIDGHCLIQIFGTGCVQKAPLA
jgi:2-iminobutanoate/2-iminopropanoate deaminase